MKIKQHLGTGLWVTDDGRVLMPPDGYRFFKFRWTYGSKHDTGYLRVRFHGKEYLVHRLVAETFLDNPLNLPTVDHINRDRTANFVGNLRFGSHKLQQNNRQICEDSLARYGVRRCEDKNAYERALRANNPEYAERKRAKCREREAKQRALGRRYRRCPDGKHHWLTDEEYEARFGNKSQ